MNKVYCCFPGGKHKALTMSYDDGRTADRRLIDIFNRYNIKGTFHLNSGLMHQEKRVSPQEVRSLYAGHEVACHTVTHPTIARCPLSEVVAEILDDRRALEDMTGYAVRGLSYPNGSLSTEIEQMLPACGIRYSRVVGSSERFGLPENPYRWMSTCHHSQRLLALGEEFLALHKKQYLYLMYVWGHSYEFEDSGNWALMEDFCRLAGGHDDVWYCTNIEFIDYMDDWKRLRFAADNRFVENPNAHDAYLSVNDGVPIRIPGGASVLL